MTSLGSLSQAKICPVTRPTASISISFARAPPHEAHVHPVYKPASYSTSRGPWVSCVRRALVMFDQGHRSTWSFLCHQVVTAAVGMVRVMSPPWRPSPTLKTGHQKPNSCVHHREGGQTRSPWGHVEGSIYKKMCTTVR